MLTLGRASAQQRGGTTFVIGVADATTGAPIENAQVRVPSIGRLVHADWLGEARIRDVPPGRYTIEVRALGYAASDITLEATGDSVGAVFLLERPAIPLDTVKVTAQRAMFGLPIFREQFENRRKMGIGRFLVDSQLAKLGTRDLALALMTSLPGLRVRSGVFGHFLLFADGPSGNVWAQDCGLSVYLDGAMYSDSSVFDELLPEDLAGVEYYDIDEAPPQYRRGGALGRDGHTGPRPCKVLLLWSKY